MDDVEITSGSVIQVATWQLRDAAARFERVAVRLSAAGSAAMSAYLDLAPPYDRAGAWELSARAGQASIAVSGVARDLRHAADVYDLAEARTLLGFLGASEAPMAERAREARMHESRIAAVLARNPAAGAEADELLRAAETAWMPGVAEALLVGPPPLALAARAVIDRLRGERDRRSSGPRPRPADGAMKVWMRPVDGPPPAPPATLAERLSRTPSDSSRARVRIERLTMPDGSRRFLVYSTGTRPGGDPRETNDGASNLDEFLGQEGASSDMIEEALALADARPGDVIDLTGHSQGAMAGDVIALKGEYEVATVLAAGPPTVVPLGEDTLSMHVAYDDDPVAMLGAGGLPGEAGSPGSLLIRGDAHGDGKVGFLPDMSRHALDGYVDLVGAAEATGDIRLQPFADALAEIATAERVEVFEFSAERLLDG